MTLPIKVRTFYEAKCPRCDMTKTHINRSIVESFAKSHFCGGNSYSSTASHLNIFDEEANFGNIDAPSGKGTGNPRQR